MIADAPVDLTSDKLLSAVFFRKCTETSRHYSKGLLAVLCSSDSAVIDRKPATGDPAHDQKTLFRYY
jgi:hypothetical protein